MYFFDFATTNNLKVYLIPFTKVSYLCTSENKKIFYIEYLLNKWKRKNDTLFIWNPNFEEIRFDNLSGTRIRVWVISNWTGSADTENFPS